MREAHLFDRTGRQSLWKSPSIESRRARPCAETVRNNGRTWQRALWPEEGRVLEPVLMLLRTGAHGRESGPCAGSVSVSRRNTNESIFHNFTQTHIL